MSDTRTLHGFVKREDWKNAYTLGNKILNTDPENAEALFLMGATCRALGFLGMGLPLLSKALSKEKKQPNLWMTYAACLHDLNRWEEAEKGFMVVHSMLPNDPMPPANIGATYVQRGMWRDAANWCDKALKIEPTNHIARISKGFACLSLGRWKDAWQYHEALYGEHIYTRIYNDPPEPDWDGTKGQTVAVRCDQGLGDQIMFAQCLPQLIADSKQVILECSKRMVGFFRRNFPDAIVYGTLKEATLDWVKDHKIDAHIHISGLGKFYRNKDADFPRLAYASADTERVRAWKEWLAPLPKPWIGIGWKGGIQATQTHIRSMTLEDMRPILELPGTFIDMSYTDNAAEIARWNIDNKSQVIRPPVDVSDYDDTIALIAALDEMVSVTTSAVHVCGALGRSCHVLVPEVAQWRYAYRYGDGTQMIWYSDGIKLYRQKPGEQGWGFAVGRVAKALKCAS